VLHNKDEFNTLFADTLGRKWIKFAGASFEDFEKFLEGLDTILIKPNDANCGHGIQKLSVKDFPDNRSLFDHLATTGCDIAEEYIIQHPEMSKMYPCSVNTIRVVTILDEAGESHIMYAAVRLGNEGRIVDNINAGGLSAPVDLETGILSKIAFDKNFNYYEEHPYTGVKIIGFQIPMWEEAKALVLDSAKRIPKLRYVGWDVAITEKGPVFVEANHHPGHDIIQMPRHTPDKIGMLPEFKKYVNI
jgi:glutathione synthase/RimK-type ligase-like ATP-grasp enzyme